MRKLPGVAQHRLWRFRPYDKNQPDFGRKLDDLKQIGRGFFALSLVVLPEEEVAPEPRKVVDKKNAFQMVDLMLDDGRLQIREILLLLLAFEIDIADAHQRGALHLGIH